MIKDRNGARWIDEGGDELQRLGHWERSEDERLSDSGRRKKLFRSSLFWTDMERLADECNEELRRAGFPEFDKSVRFNAMGQWCCETPGDTDVPWNVPTFHGASLGAYFAEQHAESFSDAWYAAKIGKHISMINDDRSASHGFHFARIFNIGVLVTEWNWRTSFKPAILTGIRQREALGQRRSYANEKAAAAKEARQEAVLKLLPLTGCEGGALEKFLVRRLCEDHGIIASRRTIRRDLHVVRGSKRKKVGQPG